MKGKFAIPFWSFLLAAVLIGPKHLTARASSDALAPAQSQEQSPAQPPQTAATRTELPPRKTLAGAWQLNRNESDDARQKIRDLEAPASTTNTNAGSYPGGGYPGGGYPGGGYPGGGYPGGGYPGGGYPGGYGYPGAGRRGGYPGGGPYGGGSRQTIADNPKMQPLMNPSRSLQVELKGPEVDVNDDQSHKLILYTDGRKLKKPKDNDQQEVAAHWDGSQLVSDEKSPLGGKMSRMFELSSDGRTLYETLHIDNGRSDTPLIIRYVYNVPTSDTQSEQNSDPNRPVLQRSPDSSGSPQ